jgi:hypothetical protein
MQPRKYSKDFKPELQKKPKTTLKVLEKPAVLSYEELGGLSDPVSVFYWLPTEGYTQGGKF